MRGAQKRHGDAASWIWEWRWACSGTRSFARNDGNSAAGGFCGRGGGRRSSPRAVHTHAWGASQVRERREPTARSYPPWAGPRTARAPRTPGTARSGPRAGFSSEGGGTSTSAAGATSWRCGSPGPASREWHCRPLADPDVAVHGSAGYLPMACDGSAMSDRGSFVTASCRGCGGRCARGGACG